MHEISYLSRRLDGVGYMDGPCCYQAISKLIIDIIIIDLL